MPRRLYRVCRAIHARLDGEGAKRVGGRWNSPGRSVVYMAETVSLAVLENLVHMSREDFPAGYVLVVAAVPDEVRILKEEDLVAEFGGFDRSRLGDRWLDGGSSAVLAVRSIVVPFEYNFLLNPQHPDFEAITVEPAVPFVFDERLFVSREFR
jgi:RES domain-containing protein